MGNSTKRITLGAALLALLVGAAARADFVPVAQPDAAYLSGTTLLSIVAADFDVVSSLSDATETVTFDTGLVALTVPTTWTSWGSPPDTESSTPRVLWSNGLTSLQMSLSAPALIFGFEAQPNTTVVSPILASFLSGGIEIGSISLDVDGNAGARLFAAFTSTDPFDQIDLSSTDDFAIANVRFALQAQVVPEPGPALLLLLGGGLMLVSLRRRSALVTRR